MDTFKLLGDVAHRLARVQTSIQYAVFMNGVFDKEVRSSVIRDLAASVQGVADFLKRGAAIPSNGKTGGTDGTRKPDHQRRRGRTKANR